MDKVPAQLRRVSRLTLLNLVVLAGVVALVSQVSNDVDRGANNAERSAAAAEDIQSYVDDLRTVTPEEAERNAQIGEVLASVPGIADDTDTILRTLCDVYPEATACQEVTGG